jgi:hypothetical protein
MTQAAKPVKKPVAPVAFAIMNNVAIPEPATFPRGPRGSIYPVEKMKAGQCFDIPVRDGKQAAQKRSYLSALGKSRGVKLVTRYMDLAEEGEAPQLVVRCWHAGPRELGDAASTDVDETE